MLNPPLYLLSDDLIGYLVEHVARLLHANVALHNLSLADRAFTEFCQKYIFRTLTFKEYEWGNGNRISMKLKTVERILDDKPLFAHQVRKIQFSTQYVHQGPLLYDDPGNIRGKDAAYAVAFNSISQLFANLPMPPHELYLSMQFHPIKDLVGTTLAVILFTHSDDSTPHRIQIQMRERSITYFSCLPQVERSAP